MPSYRSKTKPRIIITTGDPAGIGPEVTLKALASPKVKGLADFFVIGDSFALKKGFKFGKVSPACGRAAIEYIERAVDLLKGTKAGALVTAPINKEAAKLAGFKWPGHTEFLAHLSGAKKFCMMLAGGPLKVVLATTHIGIADVSGSLRAKDITDAIILTSQVLKSHFKVKRPRIAVCGLNPHAGEGGFFGREEKQIIIPAIKSAQKMIRGVSIFGPLPSDTVFYDARKGKYDAEIVMYHDQGLIPLKMLAKDTAVNVTLGLPFVRTSPAHGTAFDIAGKDKANPSSMIEAIKLAVKMASI